MLIFKIYVRLFPQNEEKKEERDLDIRFALLERI